MAQHQQDVSDEFDAAKLIVEALKKLERPQQERAIRFATEALGLQPTRPPTLATQTNFSAQTGPQASTAPHSTALSLGRPVDIKQFAESKQPKSDQQFAAVAAYYYQFEAPQSDRQEIINAELLANAARLANRRRPSRYTLNNAKKAGYFDSAGHGNFKLNTVGENLVAITLPGGEAVAAPRPSRRSNAKKRL